MHRLSKLLSILSTLAILSLLVIGCSQPSRKFPPGKDLMFTTMVGGHTVGGPYEGQSGQIRVLMDIQSVAEISGWVYSYDSESLLKVDYAHYFAILGFNGWRGGIVGKFHILRKPRFKLP